MPHITSIIADWRFGPGASGPDAGHNRPVQCCVTGGQRAGGLVVRVKRTADSGKHGKTVLGTKLNTAAFIKTRVVRVRTDDFDITKSMPETADKQLECFIAKFDPAIAKLIRQCRSIMRRRFPTANELVYDNYNFFVIGYCTTERPSDCVVSLAANAKGIGLSFYHGATLPDPHRVLEGSGNQNRFVRLDGVKALGRPEILELLDAAVAQANPGFPGAGRGTLIIRSISEKQRPRR